MCRDGDDMRIRLQPLIDLRDNIVFGHEALTVKDKCSAPYPSATEILRTVYTSGYSHNHHLFINLSAQDLSNDNFCDEIIEEYTHFSHPNVVLEVSEETHPDSLPCVNATLQTLQYHGIKSALDDFGSQYSSLSFMNELSVDVVKIDKKFVQQAPYQSKSNTILNFIVKMAHEMNCITVAEGIETQEQLEDAKRANVDLGQGFLFNAYAEEQKIDALKPLTSQMYN